MANAFTFGGKPVPLTPPVRGAQASPEQSSELDKVSKLPQVAEPDFGKLISGAKQPEDQAFYRKVQGFYQNQTPDIRNAISIAISPDSLDEDTARAFEYLRANDIKLSELKTPSATPPRKPRFHGGTKGW